VRELVAEKNPDSGTFRMQYSERSTLLTLNQPAARASLPAEAKPRWE